MYVLGLQGSPRKKGNTIDLLSAFLDECEKLGARTQTLDVPRMKIIPCQECGTCEKEGRCPINDDMQHVYHLLRQADLIVVATPVFFYGATAQLKALIDRAQCLWSRRYVFQLKDPGQDSRIGFSLAVGATKGKDLFDGIDLTSKYFFDAAGTKFKGSLNYRQIEVLGDIRKHPTALEDVRRQAGVLIKPYLNRQRILFMCTENACRSQMASAFARLYAGVQLDVGSAGSAPAEVINPVMEEAMREKGIDMAYRKPKSLEEVAGYGESSMIVTMGCGDVCPMFPGVEIMAWDLPDPAGEPIDFMRRVRDDIDRKVKELISRFD